MKINTNMDNQPDWAWLEDCLYGLQDAWNAGDADEIEGALEVFEEIALGIAHDIKDVLERNGVKSG